jgi:hypothetical protein
MVRNLAYKASVPSIFYCQCWTRYTTIRLKDSCLIFQVFINQALTVFVQLHCAHKRW